MPMHPQLTYTVYVVAALIFLGMLTWMFTYNRNLKARKITEELKGRAPSMVSEEEILLATREKEGRSNSKPKQGP